MAKKKTAKKIVKKPARKKPKTSKKPVKTTITQRVKELEAENKILHEGYSKKKVREPRVTDFAPDPVSFDGQQALILSQRDRIDVLEKAIIELSPISPPKKRLDMSDKAFRFHREDFCRVTYDFDIDEPDDTFQFNMFADSHTDIEDAQFAKKAFAQYRRDSISDLKYYKNMFWLGFGDYTNQGRWSENQALRNKPFSSGTRRKNNFMMQKEAEHFYELMKFTKGLWKFMMPGNHDVENDENVYMSQLLCDMLGCDGLGQAAEITFNFHFRGLILPLTILAQHDLAGGGGIMRETAIKRGHNANKEFGSKVAVHAHHHHLIADTDVVKSDGFKQRESISIGCGGYQLMFGDGQPVWGKLHKGIRALGTPILKVRFLDIGDGLKMLLEATPRMYLET